MISYQRDIQNSKFDKADCVEVLKFVLYVSYKQICNMVIVIKMEENEYGTTNFTNLLMWICW